MFLRNDAEFAVIPPLADIQPVIPRMSGDVVVPLALHSIVASILLNLNMPEPEPPPPSTAPVHRPPCLAV